MHFLDKKMTTISNQEKPYGILREEGKNIYPSSLNAMASIFVECFTAPPRNERWDQRSAKDYLLEGITKGAWFQISRNPNGEILGFAMIVPAAKCNVAADLPKVLDLTLTDYISVVAVSAELERRGIGTSLMAACVEDARERGISSITARNRPDAAGIKKIFERQGFRVLKECEGEIGGVRSRREIQGLELAPIQSDGGWNELDIYCLQSISLPGKVAESLLVCGRSILRGLKHRNDGTHRSEDWRWDGWRLLSEDFRVEAEDWAMLNRLEMPRLACSASLVMDVELEQLLSNSVQGVRELQQTEGVRFDPARTDILLCVNEHGSFLLLVRFCLKISPDFAGCTKGDRVLSDRLFETINREDRGVLALLQTSPWGIRLRERVNEEVRGLCNRWIKQGILDFSLAGVRWEASERYEPKTVHTVSIYDKGFAREQMSSVHKIEEFPQDSELARIISEGREEVFFQLGWSFSGMAELGRRSSLMVLRIIVELQMSWWFMRGCRNHIYRLGEKSNDPELPSKELSSAAEDALSVESSFNKFLVDHKRFRAEISPRDQLVFDEMEAKWKMKEDFELVRDMNEDLRRVAKVRADKVSEGVQQRLGFTLFVVAILQMLSMISIFKDYRELMQTNEEKEPHHGVFAAISEHTTHVFVEHMLEVIGTLALILILIPFLPQIFEQVIRRTNALLLWAFSRFRN
jgi:ribosomal protein S18 acetylase RimI-like enzyme